MALLEILAVIPVILVVCFLLLKYNEAVRQWFFANVSFPLATSYVAPKFKPVRKKLLEDLGEVVSKDEKLRAEGKIRVVEIGIGEGANLPYYGRKVDLVVVDPNENFKSTFEKKLQKFPDVRLDRWVADFGEDMKHVTTDYADVVIFTHLLCCVNDVPKVLQECKRVLAPGGRVYFMEHTGYPSGTWQYWLQLVFSATFWPVIFGGCILTKRQPEEIQKAGFSEVVCNIEFVGPWTVIARNAVGYAVK